jgi:hypothetical protein
MPDGSFSYDPSRQTLANTGPIPAGRYWIDPSELWERGFLRGLVLGQGHADAWGDYRLTIHPYPHTVTHQRGGFFIHGGTAPGSAGCIDLTTHMAAFVTALRAIVGSRDNCFIPLDVDYGSRAAAGGRRR